MRGRESWQGNDRTAAEDFREKKTSKRMEGCPTEKKDKCERGGARGKKRTEVLKPWGGKEEEKSNVIKKERRTKQRREEKSI